MNESAVTQEVFELVLARPAVGVGGEIEGLVHLWWRAPEQGQRLVQVYVDERLVDVSVDVTQREMWLAVDRGRGHRIELVAVEAERTDLLWREHRWAQGSWEGGFAGGIGVALLRDERLPVDARVVVKVDGVERVNRAMWSSADDRGGHGVVFGLGDFGHDAVSGPGLGEGELGAGALGIDGVAWRWWDGDASAGEHEVEVWVEDGRGRRVSERVGPWTQEVDRMVEGARSVEVTGDVLRWA
ncbi:MAG: hypothetical protein IT441_07370 [Phycisphaeraceae bacterium]|nr:hypothetical protein [Phycisphaeraceae bacterium]